MWSVLRSRALSNVSQWKIISSSNFTRTFCSSDIDNIERNREMLSLNEVEKILTDVRADDVKVLPVPKHVDFADYMVIATGRSAWHVRNIAQALIYKVKQKQRGVKRMLLPSVEGQEGGKWIVIDSGPIVIHALDEKVRAYYNLEKLWSTGTSNEEHTQDLDKAFIKVRRKNNSKKPAQANA
ncbi:Iojap-related, mitochondrial [Olea europaea subsp. europaea]|uniref:Iojap-related, mitochondrial n=3 Tax=Olea europaea subsp. europaea TaxID=158383 RepID=A0A8S0QVJ3_OLEEU|nr:Iojap-related, mitochondrial [Olea europaea subsp. europaea]